MWVTTDRAQQGPVFGNKDQFEGLGVFFDTYKNNRPGVVFPYVMAMLGDGHTAYDQAHDGKANELAGCSVRQSSPRSLPSSPTNSIFNRHEVSATQTSPPKPA
jgi:mannose-binding lectin 2